jgi:hypothetical protein
LTEISGRHVADAKTLATAVHDASRLDDEGVAVKARTDVYPAPPSDRRTAALARSLRERTVIMRQQIDSVATSEPELERRRADNGSGTSGCTGSPTRSVTFAECRTPKSASTGDSDEQPVAGQVDLSRPAELGEGARQGARLVEDLHNRVDAAVPGTPLHCLRALAAS